jgi:polyferredoxin
VQQLAIKRIAWKFKIPKWLDRVLGLLPFALLSLVVYVAMSKTNFNLASIEPFDGFAFRVAGWATISVFLIGVIASLFSPMAYCRYGCPTGALLGFLRFRGDSDRIGTRDWAAMALLTLAIFLWST